ncbi:hypothetical protein PALB_33190 [Pseudoalteromonas luteoviolacea B = ATCC 29581]|nr:hypothetical protein PALB_33190 [Pseudoalteromonas luteoviolacea B = ATCC 29581]
MSSLLRIFIGVFILFSFNVIAQPDIVKVYVNVSEDVKTEQLVFDYLKDNISGFVIVEEEASINRSLKNILSGDGQCVRNLVKNQSRSEALIFSEPLTYFLGLQLFLNANKEVNYVHNSLNLSEFIEAHPNLVLGVEHERSYGDEVDSVVKGLDVKNVYVKDGVENESQMHTMLVADRFDLLLEYPSIVEFNHKKLAIASTFKPKQLSIKGLDPLVPGHIACIDSDVTRAFLKNINAMLRQLKATQQYYRWHADYIDPSLINAFNENFNRIAPAEHLR